MSRIRLLAGTAKRFLLTGGLDAKTTWFQNRFDLLTRATHLHATPGMLILEPGTVCNLRCPFCSTGNRSLKLRRELLTPDRFQRIVKHLHLASLRKVHLFNWGEPLINPHLWDYVRFFSRRRIRTMVSTNLALKDFSERELVTMIRSGLSELLVGLDGMTQCTYARYRVGGRLDRVIRNLRHLVALQSRLRARGPAIIIQMLLNRFNEPEVESARKFADSLGAGFRVNENFYAPPEQHEEWIAESIKARYGRQPAAIGGRRRTAVINTPCRQLWDAPIVNANGDVLPCCVIDDPRYAVGNLCEQHIDQIWNGERMRVLRGFVVDPQASRPRFRNACERCPQRFCIYFTAGDLGGAPAPARASSGGSKTAAGSTVPLSLPVRRPSADVEHTVSTASVS